MRLFAFLLALMLALLAETSLAQVPPDSTQTLPDSTVALALPASENLTAEVQQNMAAQLLIRGLTRAFLQDHEGAIEHFTEALRHSPQDPTLFSAFATSYLALEETDLALYYAEKAHRATPDNPDYAFQLAELYESQLDYPRAIFIYKKIIEHHPKNVGALSALVRNQIANRQQKAALETLQQIISARGESVELREQMLGLQEETQDVNGMISSLETLMILEPTNRTHPHRLAQVYTQNRQADRAIAVLETHVAVHQQDEDALHQLAGLYRQTNQQDKLTALGPAYAHATAPLYSPENLRALRQTYTQNPQRATELLPQLRQWLESQPDNVEVMLLLGTILFDEGQYGESARLLEQVVRTQPRQMRAWYQASEAHLRNQAPDRAFALADEAVLLFPGQYDLLLLASRAALANSEPLLATDYLQQGLDILEAETPPQTDQLALFYEHYGDALHAQDQPSTALEYWRQALALNPENQALADKISRQGQ